MFWHPEQVFIWCGDSFLLDAVWIQSFLSAQAGSCRWSKQKYERFYARENAEVVCFFCVAPLLLSSSTSERCHISIRKSNNGKVRVAFHLKVKQKECSQGYTLASEITFPEAILPFSNMGRGRAGTSRRCGRERRWGEHTFVSWASRRRSVIPNIHRNLALLMKVPANENSGTRVRLAGLLNLSGKTWKTHRGKFLCVQIWSGVMGEWPFWLAFLVGCARPKSKPIRYPFLQKLLAYM